MFDREDTNWTEIEKLIASDGLVADQFGVAAAVIDRAGLMGPTMKTRSLTQDGMAYSYVLPVPEPSAVLLMRARHSEATRVVVKHGWDILPRRRAVWVKYCHEERGTKCRKPGSKTWKFTTGGRSPKP